jgi:predicted dehydrogenase
MGCGAVAQLFYAPALLEIEKDGVIGVEMLYDPAKENTYRLAKLFPAARICQTTPPDNMINILDQQRFAGANPWQAKVKTRPKKVNVSSPASQPVGISEEYGRVYTPAGVSELFQNIDLAIIASPPYLHADQTIAALESGAAVLCEKPMATSISQCQAMNTSAENTGRLLAVGMIRRFFPASQLIQHVIANNLLGQVKSFQFLEGSVFSWPARSASFFDKQQSGGGVLMDTGSHVLDLLIWWFGLPSECKYEDDTMGGVETNCRLELKYADRISGIVRLSRDCKLTNKCYIEFENGWLNWSLLDINTIEIYSKEELIIVDGVMARRGANNSMICTAAKPLALSDVFVAQIKNVLAALAGQEKLAVSGKEAAKSIEFIGRCYGRSRLIDMPWLSPAELTKARILGASD